MATYRAGAGAVADFLWQREPFGRAVRRVAAARGVAGRGNFARLTDEDDATPVVVLEIEDSIDLHGFQPRDVLNVVEDYLEAAIERGYAEVRLIHGRGKGVQRARIQALLGQHPAVASFRDAPATRGGWGATVVTLKPVAE